MKEALPNEPPIPSRNMPTQEPTLTPTLSRPTGEGARRAGEGSPRRFMATMRAEPCGLEASPEKLGGLSPGRRRRAGDTAPYPAFSVTPGLSRTPERSSLCPMKLRLDLLEHLTDEDILEEVLANNHRYKPEPNFSRTGVGSLSSASTAERAQEEARSTARIQRAMQRLRQSGRAARPKPPPSPRP